MFTGGHGVYAIHNYMFTDGPRFCDSYVYWRAWGLCYTLIICLLRLKGLSDSYVYWQAWGLCYTYIFNDGPRFCVIYMFTGGHRVCPMHIYILAASFCVRCTSLLAGLASV